MSKKKRKLSSFQDVARIEEEESGSNINNNINDNINNNVTVHSDLNDILGEGKKKKLVVKGIYFEEDVARALDAIKDKKGRGSQSKLVNHAVKRLLQEKEMLE